MFDHWYALDLGGHACRFYDFLEEKECSLPTLIAWQDKQAIAVGQDALRYVYKDQRKTSVKEPLDYNRMMSSVAPLVQAGMKQLESSHSVFRPRALVVVPTETSEEQLYHWQTEINKAGIAKIDFMTVMDALQTIEPTMLIHCGHTYTEIGVYSHEQRIVLKTIFFAGKHVDELIQKKIAELSNCLITFEDARALKEAASQALWKGKNATLLCNAKNQRNEFVQVTCKAMDLWPCMKSVIDQVTLWAKQCMERVSVEMKEQIHENGILLSGGMANCFGLRQNLQEELNHPVICTNRPESDLIENMKGWK